MNFSEFNKKGMGVFINLDRYGLSSFALKIIAVITMVLDHTAVIFLNDSSILYSIMRGIGRLSFPIFCFLLVEGFIHTTNRKKHGLMLFLFAIISEIPYDLMDGKIFDLSDQNVFFTLFTGYIAIWLLYLNSINKIRYPQFILKRIDINKLNTLFSLAVTLGAVFLSYKIHMCYELSGVLLIICFYSIREYQLGNILVNLIFNMGLYNPGLQWFGSLSVIPIALYSKKRGKRKMKLFFYLFYPVHLLLLVAIKFVIN